MVTMRCVTYAGETVRTTDDVAEALVVLTAAVARVGEAEAARIPIVLEDGGDVAQADLVIGVGNDVLSAPTDWDGPEPDFSAEAERLRAHKNYHRSAGAVSDADDAPPFFEPELDGMIDAI